MKELDPSFDELDMDDRVKFVKLCGTTLSWGIDKFYGRITSLEERARIIFRTKSDIQDETFGEDIALSKHFLVKNNLRPKSLGTVDSFLLLKKTSV